MKRYMDRAEEIIRRYPDRPLLCDAEETVTYAQAGEESARVYAWLKQRGIGREQFVLILTPRNAHILSCMLGVWKAGAAFVLVQENYPAERIDFIRRDTAAAVVLDRALFQEIQKNVPPLAGHEETGLHDAAYAVYTSGTTGNPKGVLHEFGNVEESTREETDEGAQENRDYPVSNHILQTPMAFVASVTRLLNIVLHARTAHIVPEDLIRDFSAFTKKIEELKLTGIYLPPSYIRLYKNPSPYLRTIQTSSEPANGIHYPGGRPKIVNSYAASETGFPIMRCVLDRAYDVAPVGRPLPGVEVRLIDEEGQVVEGPGRGVLWVRDEYVGGCIPLREETGKAFQNGMFRTGDVFRRDEEGVYFLEGREDDMIKIDGNRIEPSEIEAAVEQATGLSGVMARGFQEGGRAYVCTYFLQAEAEALGIWDGKRLALDGEALARRLPRYMIPTYYIPLADFPRTPSGKLSRKDLRAPAVSDYLAEYEPPQGEAETVLCEKMAAVLGLERIGRKDDFFTAGGDSLRCIRLIDLCRDELPLDARLVHEFRTAEEIVRHMADGTQSEEEAHAEDAAALRSVLPLTPVQKINFIYQSYAPTCDFLVLKVLRPLGPDMDLPRLTRAVNAALAAHPPLHTRFFAGEDGTVMQRYDESFLTTVEVTELIEAELKTATAAYGAAFTLLDSKLYRCGIFHTEKGVYLGFFAHHALMDGESMGVLMKDILALYRNEEIHLAPDRYFTVIRRLSEAKDGPGYRTAKAFFEERFAPWRDRGIPPGLRTERESRARRPANLTRRRIFPKTAGHDSAFYMAACMLAEAWYNGEDAAYLATVSAARDSRESERIAGCLITAQALCLDISGEPRPGELLRQAREQIRMAQQVPEYCYLTEKIGDCSDMIRFIYQHNLGGNSGTNTIAEHAPDIWLPEAMPGILSVNIFDQDGAEDVDLSIWYSRDHYTESEIAKYVELMEKAVAFLKGGPAEEGRGTRSTARRNNGA